MFVGNKRPELKDIEDHVVIKYATIWKQLGKYLDIDNDLLNIIEKDNPRDCVNCCSKMLHEWLDTNPNASWGILLEAANKAQNVSNMMSEKLDTAADKLPDTVEKLDKAADRLCKVVDRQCSLVEKTVEVSYSTENVEGTDNNFILSAYVCMYKYREICSL